MANKLGLDDRPIELKLGESFSKNANTAFHSMRYDFKPASMDPTRMSSVEVGENNSVMVTVPHVEGSGTTHTVYKGNKRPSQKECVLFIDRNTGEITLEKLANTIQLKKTRLENKSKIRELPRAATPVEQPKVSAESRASPSLVKQSSPANQKQIASKEMRKPNAGGRNVEALSDTMSSSNSDSDSGSESDDSGNSSEDEPPPVTRDPVLPQPPPPVQNPKPFASLINEDLCLSESSSDSD